MNSLRIATLFLSIILVWLLIQRLPLIDKDCGCQQDRFFENFKIDGWEGGETTTSNPQQLEDSIFYQYEPDTNRVTGYSRCLKECPGVCVPNPLSQSAWCYPCGWCQGEAPTSENNLALSRLLSENDQTQIDEHGYLFFANEEGEIVYLNEQDQIVYKLILAEDGSKSYVDPEDQPLTLGVDGILRDGNSQRVAPISVLI